MTSLTLELSNLSLANLRVMEPFLAPVGSGAGEVHEPEQISFPKQGFKVLLAGTAGNQFVSYIYIFAQDQAVDWLYRLNGKDHYGATFSMFRGSIRNNGNDCTETFWRNPGQVLAVCPSLRLLRREHRRESYVLNQDPSERRIHLEFGATEALERVILG